MKCEINQLLFKIYSLLYESREIMINWLTGNFGKTQKATETRIELTRAEQQDCVLNKRTKNKNLF